MRLNRQRLHLTFLLTAIVSLSHNIFILLLGSNESPLTDTNHLNGNPADDGANDESRRLSDTNKKSSQQHHHWYQDVPHLLSLAKSTTATATPFR
eukprot:scaffold59273_cov20-Cyclotella_meneghiniana.AAC.1